MTEIIIAAIFQKLSLNAHIHVPLNLKLTITDLQDNVSRRGFSDLQGEWMQTDHYFLLES